MNSMKWLAVLFTFVGLFLAGCSDQQQLSVTPSDQGLLEKVVITNFTFSHYPTGLTGEGTIKLVGNNWIFKDVGVTEIINSSDPLGGGTMTHYLSCTLSAVTGEGPVHGYFTIVPQEYTGGGVWEGNYTGYRSKMPGSDTLFVLPLHLVAHGRGGSIEGMQMQSYTEITAWGTPPTGWYGAGDGYYKSHD